MRTGKRAAPKLQDGGDSASASIYQLKVTLTDVRPPIWRRILVRGDLRLDRLHAVLQVVMGWTNSHLHQFIVGEDYYSDPKFELSSWDMEFLDERKATIGDILPTVLNKAVYEYDFGDGWYHVLALEKRLAPDPSLEYPRCIAGRRACPPEDCGGVGGYGNLLAALANPRHEEHEDITEWLGREYNAEAFSADEVNKQLRKLTSRWQRQKKQQRRAPQYGWVLAHPK